MARLKREVAELRNSTQHSFSSTPTSAQSYTSDRGSFMDPAHLQVFNELLKVPCFFVRSPFANTVFDTSYQKLKHYPHQSNPLVSRGNYSKKVKEGRTLKECRRGAHLPFIGCNYSATSANSSRRRKTLISNRGRWSPLSLFRQVHLGVGKSEYNPPFSGLLSDTTEG